MNNCLKIDDARKKKKLKKIDNKINELYEQYISGEVSADTYLFSLGKLQNDREMILQALKVIKLDNLTKWEELKDEQRKDFIHKYLDYLVVSLDLKIVVKFIGK